MQKPGAARVSPVTIAITTNVLHHRGCLRRAGNRGTIHRCRQSARSSEETNPSGSQRGDQNRTHSSFSLIAGKPPSTRYHNAAILGAHSTTVILYSTTRDGYHKLILTCATI